MPPQIPGYFYDAEKNRYFKVENSRTAPSNAAWSSDNVKRRKLEDEEAAAANRRMNLNKHRIVRAKAMSEPLTGGFLAREFGELRLDVPAACFARGLVEKGKLPLSDARWNSNTNIKHMYVAGTDHKTGICTAYATLDELTLISTYVPRDKDGRVHRRLISNYVTPFHHVAPYRELAIPQISDIKYHERSNKILVASRSPSSEVSTWAFNPKVTRADDPRPHWLIGHNGVSLYLNMKASGDINFSDYAANTITPAPNNSNLVCVVGTSRGLASWEYSGHMKFASPWGPGQYYISPDAFRDIFAAVFVHNHRDLVLFGGRPGKLFVGDLRVKADQWDHLSLPGPITHVRSTNEHQALVAGLHNTLSIYDLRFTGRNVDVAWIGSSSNPNPNPNDYGTHQPPSKRPNASTPVLVFPEYRNLAHIDIGFDYDACAGLVAAAHDDGTMALYSVRSGRRLRSRDVDRVASARGPIQSVQFQTFPGDPTPTLFVGEHSSINAYSFGVDDPADEA
ncbi:hypothetical protein F4779DRAFT_445861 [Xylariaceae sp. FL0662B]|nr:hypothetical protein F4779DRAFT_445861 [Xylariaceae sp. FL0662B]